MRRILVLVAAVIGFLVAYVVVGNLQSAGVLERRAPLPLPVIIAIPLLLFPVLFVILLRAQLRGIAKFEVRPLQGELSVEFRNCVEQIKALGFTPIGSPVSFVGKLPLSLQPLIARDQLSYAAVFEYSAKPFLVFDFDSWLADGRLVNSISFKATGRGPIRPDILIQAFPNSSPAELLKRHHEALASLTSPPKILGATVEEYIASCRETYSRQFAKLGTLEIIQMLIPGSSPHLVPIASRPR